MKIRLRDALLAATLTGVIGTGLAVHEFQRWARSVESRQTKAIDALQEKVTLARAESIAALQSRLAVLGVTKALGRSSIEAISDDYTYDQLDFNWGSQNNTSGRVELPCLTDQRQVVIVTLGQSNAANTGEGLIEASDNVVNFNLYDRKCYRAKDPLLSASNDKANFATRLGMLLTGEGLYNRVLIAPIAMGGTYIQNWAPPGILNRRILVLIKRLAEAGLKPDFILWHQGEGNVDPLDLNGTIYSFRLSEVIASFRAYGIDAPFFVARATKCGPDGRAGAEYVRTAQTNVEQLALNAFPGPDTDTLGDDFRYDKCHLNAAGLQRHAEMWADVLKAYMQSSQHRTTH